VVRRELVLQWADTAEVVEKLQEASSTPTEEQHAQDEDEIPQPFVLTDVQMFFVHVSKLVFVVLMMLSGLGLACVADRRVTGALARSGVCTGMTDLINPVALALGGLLGLQLCHTQMWAHRLASEAVAQAAKKKL